MYAAKWHLTWSILFTLLFSGLSHAFTSNHKEPEEILLELQVERLLVFDLDGYLSGDVLFLPLGDLLSHLKIPHQFTDSNQLHVHFPDGNHTIHFNFQDGTVRTSNGTISFSEEDWISTDWGIYFNREILKEIFDIEILFDYKRLLVMVSSDHELPVIKNYNRQEKYDSFQRREVRVTPQVNLKPKRRILSVGTADWTLNSSHNMQRQSYSYGLALGGQLLGGVGSVSLRGNDQRAIHSDNIRGYWRLPVYGSSWIRQISAGDQSHINPYSQGSLSYRGVEITNRPNASRRFFDRFHASNRLQPGWDVELYSNNQMIDFARSQQTESFEFNEPLTYGTNRYTLKYFSPDGFSHEEIHYILVPQSLLPAGELEYSLSAGRYRTRDQDFARGNVRLGLTSSLTLGGGTQVVSNPVTGPEQLVFAETTMNLGGSFLVEGNHTFGYTSRASMRYIFPSARSITMQMQKFYRSSRFNISRKKFEGTINTSFPIKLGEFRLNSSFSARNTHYDQYHDINLYGSLSAPLLNGYRLQLRSQTVFRSFWREHTDLVRSDVSIAASKRVMRRVLLRPTVDYNHRLGKVTAFGVDANSRVFRNGNLNFSATYDQLTGQSRFMVSFRFELPYARHRSQARTSSAGNPSYSQTTSGTLAWDGTGGGFEADNRSWNGRAALKIQPYLIGESEGKNYLAGSADQLEVTVYDEMMQPRSFKGDLIHNLTPYREYIVKVHSEGFDNPLWRLKSNTFSITVLPNMVNTLPVPVTSVGEISGRIISKDNIPLKGLAVELRKKNGSHSQTLQTWSGGKFYFVGLEPGEYEAVLDVEQLQKRSLKTDRESFDFRIKPTSHGDIVDGLKFEVSRLPVQSQHDILYVQVGAFENRSNAVNLANFIRNNTTAGAEVVFDPGSMMYKCRAGIFHSEDEVNLFLKSLRSSHLYDFDDAFIIRKE